MAWFEEEHAVDTVKPGPVIPYAMDIWLVKAFAMMRGIASGLQRVFWRKTQLLPEPVGDQAIKPGTFIYFVEVRHRFAFK